MILFLLLVKLLSNIVITMGVMSSLWFSFKCNMHEPFISSTDWIAGVNHARKIFLFSRILCYFM
jgi:hypothetical protein